MRVMFHIENYNDATYIAFSEPHHELKGSELLAHFTHMICSDKLARISGLDFTDISDGGGDPRVNFCHDDSLVILKVDGHNGARGDQDYFESLAKQMLYTLREDFGCDKFSLRETIESKEILLNQYNVLLITWSDAIRIAILSISEEMAWRITGKIVMEPIPISEKTLLLKDSISELTNIVLGQTVKYFDHLSAVDLGTPLLIQANANLKLISDIPLKQSICGSVDAHIKLIGINY